MARTYSATFPFLLPPSIASPALPRFRLTPPLASSICARFPSKRTKRKNHLRPKILKTLTKPFPTAPLPDIVPLDIILPNPIPAPPENDTVFDPPSDEIPCESLPPGEADKFEEFRVSETISRAEAHSSIVSKISVRSVFKFCGYLVGVFMFQAFCAVFLLDNTDSSKKEKRLINFDGKGSILLNGSNVVYFDETEMQERISEIRAMARDAREREKTERKENNNEDDFEREIGARLAKLEKRLSSKRENLPGSFMNYLGLFENEVDDKTLELNEDHENLMFKRKLRFKNPSARSRTSPKGFSGSSDPRSSSGARGIDPNGKPSQSDCETIEIDSGREAMNRQFNSSQIDGNNLRKEKVDLRKELDSVMKSFQSKESEKQNSQTLTKEYQKAPTKSNGLASSSRKVSRDLGKRQLAKVGDKQSAVQADLWWLNLPYVLAILMRRGSDHEESAGLYALRTLSGEDDQGESSYTVAFEDRGDANNFCFLLESYFEDLGDFSADIVPLSIKEIHEAVKSSSKKVIVVKKGQLKLYAGQPFAEVEMALWSLLGQD